MNTTPLLRMSGIHKRFGSTQALAGVSLDVFAGRALALVGENGAGKSTLMKILSGAYLPDGGRMQLGDREYAPAGPLDARRAGVAMIYQELNLAPDLSVAENIMLGQEVTKFGFVQRKVQRARVRQALELLGHPELKPDVPVRKLSVAVQQLVEIARALVMDARLIVFDEPTSSLTQRDVRHLFEVIRRLKAQGIGIIYISHFLEETREVCDDYVVLRDGSSVGDGKLADATQEHLISLMVGRSVTELFPQIPHTIGRPLLTVRGLTGKSSIGRKSPQDVSFDLHRGEILGIAGLVGAGRTELLRALFALDSVRSGNIKIAEMTPPGTPCGRIQNGMGYVSEDRKGEGLAQSRSIADNMTYSRLAPYSRFGWLNLKPRQRAVKSWMDRLRIKARSQEQFVQDLSGGNQQKVAIARLLHQQAEILLLDEPTRGIDVGTKVEIYRLIGEQAAEGKCVLFVSSYMPELLAVCDRVAVMSRGELREIRPAGEWTEAEILKVAISSSADEG
ncbi:MAG: sugar ABC transporter ATP-binding protein [Planctomycetaceae bacterium]